MLEIVGHKSTAYQDMIQAKVLSFQSTQDCEARRVRRLIHMMRRALGEYARNTGLYQRTHSTLSHGRVMFKPLGREEGLQRYPPTTFTQALLDDSLGRHIGIFGRNYQVHKKYTENRRYSTAVLFRSSHLWLGSTMNSGMRKAYSILHRPVFYA